ncbi:MAG TPA: glycosyltransferase [Taishania sp.]|nr:glycosyltransferase [Taishania sp.]
MDSKPNIVFVVSRFPYPLEKGDKLRAYYQIKELCQNYNIHLIALSDKRVPESSIQELKKYCVSVEIHKLSKLSILFNSFLALLGNKPIQVGYFYNYLIHLKIAKTLESLKPDYIFTQLTRTTEYTKDYHACRKTLDYMDAFSKGMERRIKDAKWYNRWFFKLEYRRLLAYERAMFDYYEQKTIISEQDKKYIFHPDKTKIICAPNGIDTTFFESQQIEKKYDFAFVGNMSYPPNIEAVTYIVKRILPHFSESKLLIAGANPHPKIEKMAKQNPQIVVSGWMDDIREAYSSSHIFLAPMKTGTGMQNKLLEAMAQGIPCVTTSLANNAIQAIDNESIFVCDSEEQLIPLLRKLLDDSNLRNTVGQKGKHFVEQHYSWQSACQNLIDIH